MKTLTKVMALLGAAYLTTATLACDEGKESSATAKKDGGGEKAEKADGDDGGGDISTKPLDDATCTKACRKWNIECAPKGAKIDDPEGPVKMCADVCVMTTKEVGDTGIVSWAQAHCMGEGDCKAFKDCVKGAEAKLKKKLK